MDTTNSNLQHCIHYILHANILKPVQYIALRKNTHFLLTRYSISYNTNNVLFIFNYFKVSLSLNNKICPTPVEYPYTTKKTTPTLINTY